MLLPSQIGIPYISKCHTKTKLIDHLLHPFGRRFSFVSIFQQLTPHQGPIDVLFFHYSEVSLTNKFVWTQWPHKDGCSDVSRQVSFRQLTIFASFRGFKPNSHSLFRLQTTPHDIFAFLGFNTGPDTRMHNRGDLFPWGILLVIKKRTSKNWLYSWEHSILVVSVLPSTKSDLSISWSVFLFVQVEADSLELPSVWLEEEARDIEHEVCLI